MYIHELVFPTLRPWCYLSALCSSFRLGSGIVGLQTRGSEKVIHVYTWISFSDPVQILKRFGKPCSQRGFLVLGLYGHWFPLLRNVPRFSELLPFRNLMLELHVLFYKWLQFRTWGKVSPKRLEKIICHPLVNGIEVHFFQDFHFLL